MKHRQRSKYCGAAVIRAGRTNQVAAASRLQWYCRVNQLGENRTGEHGVYTTCTQVILGFRRHSAQLPPPRCPSPGFVEILYRVRWIQTSGRAHAPLSRETGCCVCRESELTRLRRHTDRQAGRETQRSEGRGGDSLFRRIEPSPLLFPPRAPRHFPSALDGGKAEHNRSAQGCFSRCLYGWQRGATLGPLRPLPAERHHGTAEPLGELRSRNGHWTQSRRALRLLHTKRVGLGSCRRWVRGDDSLYPRYWLSGQWGRRASRGWGALFGVPRVTGWHLTPAHRTPLVQRAQR